MIDGLMERTYDSSEYNCAHFAADVWELITAQDIRPGLYRLMTGRRERFVDSNTRHAFVRLEQPQSPCLVLMRNRVGTPEPHIGVWYNRKVFHICERGVEYLPLECITYGYHSVRFYGCRW